MKTNSSNLVAAEATRRSGVKPRSEVTPRSQQRQYDPQQPPRSLGSQPPPPRFCSETPIQGFKDSTFQRPSRFTFYVLRQTAFSLIEIMVAMALLSFIVIGLLAMFHQVQKAFRSSLNESDILEAGRSVGEMIARDIEQMTASSISSTSAITLQPLNFFAVVSPDFSASLQQPLPGSQMPRTNVVQTMFFMSKANQDWIGTGYQVRPDYANAGIGTLYRYSTNVSKARAWQLSQLFLNELPPLGTDPTNRNLNRIADGVVDFRIRAYDTNGVEITITNTSPVQHLAFPALVNGARRLVPISNSYGSWDTTNGQYNYYFVSNAIPASVELEVAFLETHILDRYRGIAAGLTAPIPQAIQDAQRQFLSNHVANVHVFRQRIPIRNVDPSAYQ